jgi:hypothetical protein
VSVPYGRALGTLRHKYDAAIKCYFESRGFCVNKPPGAARVAAVFKKLCVITGSNTLPEEARWFDFSATWFDDKHEKPFRTTLGSCITQAKVPLGDAHNAPI